MNTDVPGRGAFRDHRFFIALLAVNVILARLAMRFYGEQFVLLQHAISDLGATVTLNGFPNRRAPIVFTVEMVTSGVMCLRYAYLIARRGDPKDTRVWLLRMGAAGFFLMPAPHNLPVTHYIHMFGGGFIFFTLWMLTMIYLIELRRRGWSLTFWLGMLVLQATVLTYAVTFAIDWEFKQFTQGIGLVGLIGTLVWGTFSLGRLERVAESGDSVEDVATTT